MRVWLDDIRDPADSDIRRGFGSVGDEVWVKTVEEAIGLLRSGEVTSISLDNDLGEGLGEGYGVALWVEEQAFLGNLQPLTIMAHTQNPVARGKMYAAFKNARRYWKSAQQ